MKIKAVVKVMNFHSLLHINAARKTAEKYFRLENEINKLIDLIVNNRNFILDKHILKVNPRSPVLNIYIGSDFGFCGSVNSKVNERLLADDRAQKIVIGKKLRFKQCKPVLFMTRDGFEADSTPVEEFLERAIQDLAYSEINIIYNHYYDLSRISMVKKKVFPLSLVQNVDELYTEDFTVEGNVDDLLKSLISSYVTYEVKIAFVYSFASENIARQNATTESLKKIDERIEELALQERKEKKQKSFRKVVESFVKTQGFGGNKL